MRRDDHIVAPGRGIGHVETIAVRAGVVDGHGARRDSLVVQLQLDAAADVVGQIDADRAGRGIEIEDVVPVVGQAGVGAAGTDRAVGSQAAAVSQQINAANTIEIARPTRLCQLHTA